jgi:probable H4MPT-linked C1 transfer pathway protein
MRFLALDIGGANIKAADGQGYAASYPFALWRQSATLAHELRMIISEAPPCDRLAITMTGELADCFATKAEGVKHILTAVAAGSDNRHTRVYLSDGRLVTPQVAMTLPQLASASNWHALARFAGRFFERGVALLIDIGSTTTDLVPLVDGQVLARGTTDTTRLLADELLYTGVVRSPVCAVTQRVPYRGQDCPVAQELFATMLDVYIVLGQMEERPADHHTADGKPATKAAARTRLGRMVAADSEEFNHRDAVALAEAVANAQLDNIVATVRRQLTRLPQPPQAYILSGEGEFLARMGLEDLPSVSTVFSLSDRFGDAVSRAAPAHALAVLAAEALQQ